MKIRHTIENNITWEQLKAAAEAGTAESLAPLKSEIDLTLEGGEAVTVVVAAHLPATADKPAGIRFVFKDALAEPHRMNDDWTNKGGYKASEGRRYILEEVYPRLPADLRALIRPRKIVENIREGVLEYEDPLWLPSETDMFGRGEDSWQHGKVDGPDDFQLPIYMTERDRVKLCGDYGTYPQWCRSVIASYTGSFCLVYTYGSAGYIGAYISCALAPGFDF